MEQEITDPIYRGNVYKALKSKVQGFDKTEEEFYKSLENKDYVNNVYKALKSKVQGFDKDFDTFNDLMFNDKQNTVQKPQLIEETEPVKKKENLVSEDTTSTSENTDLDISKNDKESDIDYDFLRKKLKEKTDETPQDIQNKKLEDILSGKTARENKIKDEKLRKKRQVASETLFDLKQHQDFPELTAEKDSLLKELSQTPSVLFNTEIENRIEQIDEAMKPKSFRKIRKNDLSVIVSKMDELEKKDIELGQNGNLIATSGTYKELNKQRKIIQQDIDNENLIIKKLSTDVSNYELVFSMFSHDIETVKLNERTEENILLEIDKNPYLKQIILSDGEERNHLHITKRENIIKKAREQAYLDNKNELRTKAEKILTDYRRGKYEKGSEKEIINKLNALEEEEQTLSTIYKIDLKKQQIKDVFAKTTKSKEYEEYLKDNKLLDVISTGVEGLAHITTKTAVAIPSFISTIADAIFTDEENYSSFDKYNDALHYLSSPNLLPSSQQASGRLTGEGSEISFYSIGKTAISVAPLVFEIKRQAQKGNVRGIYKKIGKLLNLKDVQKFARNLGTAEVVYKSALSDNIKQAKDLGLTNWNVVMHSQATTLASALINIIVPDYKYFDTASGVLLKKGFASSLEKAISKEAKKQVIKDFFKNIAGEVGEETLEGVIGELASIGLVDDYQSKLKKVNFYKDIMINTIAGTGGLAVKGLHSNYKATKNQAYKDITDNFEGVYQQFELAKENLTDETAIKIIENTQQHVLDINNAIKSSNYKKEEVDVSDNNIDYLKNKLKGSKQQIRAYLKRKSEENKLTVSAKQIDYLIEKKKLIEEAKGKDGVFKADLLERIKGIDKSIEEENVKIEEKQLTAPKIYINREVVDDKLLTELLADDVFVKEIIEGTTSVNIDNNLTASQSVQNRINEVNSVKETSNEDTELRNLTKEERSEIEEKYNVEIEDNLGIGDYEVTASKTTNSKNKNQSFLNITAKNRIAELTGQKKINENTKDTKETKVEEVLSPENKNVEETVEVVAVNSEFANKLADNVNDVEDLTDLGQGLISVKKGATKVIIKEDADTITLESIETDETSKGLGGAKKVIKEITDLADETKQKIELKVVPKDSKTTEQGLVKLYEKAGFQKDTDFDTNKKMVRNPSDNEVKSETTDKPEKEIVKSSKRSINLLEKSVALNKELLEENPKDEFYEKRLKESEKKLKFAKENALNESETFSEDFNLGGGKKETKNIVSEEDNSDYNENILSEYEKSVEIGIIDDSLIDALDKESIDKAYSSDKAKQELERLKNPDNSDIFTFLNHALGRITPKDYDNYGDRKARKGDKSFSIRFLDSKARPLDTTLQELSEQFGSEITPQDAIDFINDKVGNPEKYHNSKAKLKQLEKSSKIDLTSQSKAYENYKNLKNDTASFEILDKLADNNVLSYEQVDIIKTHLKLKDEANRKTSGSIQQSNELVARSESNHKKRPTKKEASSKTKKETVKPDIKTQFKAIYGVEMTRENLNKAKNGKIKPISKTKFKKASITSVKKLVSTLRKALKVKVVLDSAKFNKRLSEITGKKLIDKDGKVYGFLDTKKGAIYLNPELLNHNTPIHEFAHVYINSLKLKNRKLYDKGISLIKNSKYYQEVDGNKSYANLSEKQKLDEALVTAIGDKGEAFLNDNKSVFTKFLNELKEWLGKSFFKDYKSEIDNLTLNQFLDGSLHDLLNGVKLDVEIASSQDVHFQEDSGFNFDEAFDFINEEEKLSGIKVALLIDRKKQNHSSFDEHIAQGKINVETGVIDVEQVILAVLNQKLNLNEEQISALIYYKTKLDNERSAILKELSDENTPEYERGVLQSNLGSVEAKITQYLLAQDESGYRAGLSFVIRRIMLNSEYDIVNEINKFKAINDGIIPKEIRSLYNKLDKKYKETLAELDDLQKKFDNQKIKLNEKVISESNLTKKELVKHKKLSSSLKGIFDNAVMFQSTGTPSKLTPTQIKQLKAFSKSLYKKVNGDFTLFKKELIDALGESASDKAKQVFELNDKGIKYDGNVLIIPSNIIRNLVEEGYNTPEKLTDRVIELLLEKGITDVSERFVRDTISNYGKTSEDKRDDIAKEISKLKSTAKLISALEDVEQKMRPKRSGRKPLDKTTRQRELTKKINAGLKDIPLNHHEEAKLWKSALDKIKSNLKNRIEDVQKQIDENKRVVIKQKNTKLDDETIRLQKELKLLNEILDKQLGDKTLTDQQKIKDAELRIEKSITELERQIKEKDFDFDVIPRIQSDELTKLRAEQKKLVKKRNELKYNTLTDQQKTERQERIELERLHRRIASINAKIDDVIRGIASKPTFNKKVTNQAIENAKTKIEQLNEQLNNLKDQKGITSQKINERRKKQVERYIEIYKERIRTKDFATKKRKIIDYSQEIKKKEVELELIKEQFLFEKFKQELRNRTWYKKLADFGVDMLGSMRSFMASFDISGVWRQGKILAVRNPRIFAHSFVNMLQDMGDAIIIYFKRAGRRVKPVLQLKFKDALHVKQIESRLDRWETDYRADDMYLLMKNSKLFVSLDSPMLRSKEEEFSSRFAKIFPHVHLSDVAYTSFLNRMRVGVFKAKAQKLIDKGFDPIKDKKQFDDLAKVINNSSGRGVLLVGDKSSKEINTILFASKYLSSRLSFFNPSVWLKLTKEARIEKALDFLALGITASAEMLLSSMVFGYKMETDCRSSDFLKARKGNLRLDFAVGFQQVLVLMCRIARGSTKSTTGNVKKFNDGGFWETSRGSVISRFGRSKLSPVASLAVAFSYKEEYMGEKFQWDNAIINRVTPMVFNDMQKIIRNEGQLTGVTSFAHAFLGNGVQYYEEPKKKKKKRKQGDFEDNLDFSDDLDFNDNLDFSDDLDF